MFSAEDETLVWITCLHDSITSGESDLLPVEVRLQDYFTVADDLQGMRAAALLCLMSAPKLLAEGLTLGDVVSHVRSQLDINDEQHGKILKKFDAASSHEALARSLIHRADLLRGRFGKTYIFTTQDGRMGHSPRSVAPGDRICLVPGGKCLHIFSIVTKRYVTCAAVHGLMDDSLLSIVHERNLEWHMIDIH